MASFSHFSEVLEEESNALIQKAIPEKTKIVRKYGLKNFKGTKKMNLKYQFDCFTGRIVGCLNKFNNCLSKKCRCSFVSFSESSTKTIKNPATLDFYCQSIGDRNCELVF